MDLVDESEMARERLIMAAKKLEQKGVRAIAGDCGLLARYQKEIASELKIPFISSSLMLIPLIWQIQGQTGRIGVLTGHSKLLKQEHLIKAGVPQDIPLAIYGMEDEEEFIRAVINKGVQLDTEKMKKGVLNACRSLISNNVDVRSIVLECSNLPSFAYDIYKDFGIPVYDIVGLAKLIFNSVCPQNYNLHI